MYFLLGTTFALLYLLRKWAQGGKCHSKTRLDGKIVVITGANNGIGKETAVDLATRGATVIMACRDLKRSEPSLQDIKERSGNPNVHLMVLDLSSLDSIHEFCTSFLVKYEKLHILVNNAGLMMKNHAKTSDGFEMTMGVNHLGHFALTNLLLKRIVESAPSRIINVSSRGHTHCPGIDFADINSEKNYGSFPAYSQSKLANVLFTKELSRKLKGTGVSTYSLHPGIILTHIGHDVFGESLISSFLAKWIFGFIGKSVKQGAQTTIYCAVAEDIEEHSGQYFSDCALRKSVGHSYDEGVAKKLWEVSEKMTRVEFRLQRVSQ